MLSRSLGRVLCGQKPGACSRVSAAKQAYNEVGRGIKLAGFDAPSQETLGCSNMTNFMPSYAVHKLNTSHPNTRAQLRAAAGLPIRHVGCRVLLRISVDSKTNIAKPCHPYKLKNYGQPERIKDPRAEIGSIATSTSNADEGCRRKFRSKRESTCSLLELTQQLACSTSAPMCIQSRGLDRDLLIFRIRMLEGARQL